MNVLLLFLSRSDVAAIPRIPQWLTQQKAVKVLAFANPHLILPDTVEQTKLEDEILSEVYSDTPDSSRRLRLELELQKPWMQMPRSDFDAKSKALYSRLGTPVNILNDSFQPDRIAELLMKIRPVWPKEIKPGQFTMIFPNQIPEIESPVTTAIKKWEDEHKRKDAEGAPGNTARLAPKSPKDEPKPKRVRTAAQLANDEQLRAKAAARRGNLAATPA